VFRVHDVRAHRQALDVAHAIVRRMPSRTTAGAVLS
jgi:dihydropteroate synthase